MSSALSHPELLTCAKRARVAATEHDLEHLQRETTKLLDAFVEHTAQERVQLQRLPTFSARLVRRGQERLLDQLIALLVEAEDVATACRCEQLGTDVIVRLALQADAERRAFGRAGINID